MGRTDDTNSHYAAFETLEKENAAGGKRYASSRFLLANHDKNLDEALALAQKERARRKDIYTCDTLAWALYKKGQFAAARSMMDEALASAPSTHVCTITQG